MQGLAADFEERIRNVITNRLRVDINAGDLTRETPLIGKGLGLDSIGVLELVVGLEEEFGIVFEDKELRIDLFENIGSIADYIAGKART